MPAIHLRAYSSSPFAFFEIFTDRMEGRTFEHSLQRLEGKMADNGYAVFTDRSGFRYSLTLLRKDTRETLARYSVRNPLSPPAIRLPSTLHSCPLPLHLLPPGPLAGVPVVPYQLPRRLRRAARRVQISDPPLLALQLYQSDEQKPRCALASITVDGLGQAVTQDLAPMGTTEAFALDMWKRVFASRTGRQWDDQGKGQNTTARQRQHVWDGKQVLWTLMDGVDGEAGASASLRPTNATGDTRAAAERGLQAASMPDSAINPAAATATANKTPSKVTAKRTMVTGKIRKPDAAATSTANDVARGSCPATPAAEGSVRTVPQVHGPAKGSVLAGYLKDIE